LEVELKGKVQLGIIAYPTDAQGLHASQHGKHRIEPATMKIYVTLSVPAGQQAQWTSDKFRIQVEQEPVTYDLQLTKLRLERMQSLFEPHEFAPTELLGGASAERPWMFGTTTEHAFYAGWLTPFSKAPAKFQLNMPALLVNGERQLIPPITFGLRDGYAFYGAC
jgi:hypothetical protein